MSGALSWIHEPSRWDQLGFNLWMILVQGLPLGLLLLTARDFVRRLVRR